MNTAEPLEILTPEEARERGIDFAMTEPVKLGEAQEGVLDADIAGLETRGIPWAIVSSKGPAQMSSAQRLNHYWVALWRRVPDPLKLKASRIRSTGAEPVCKPQTNVNHA